MLVDNKIILNNSKGSISFSKNIIEQLIFEYVKDSLNLSVEKFDISEIKEFNKIVFNVEIKKEQNQNFLFDKINKFQESLSNSIVSHLNITNFNLFLIFQ